MPVVTLPEGEELEFPDGMAEAEMRAAIEKNFPKYSRKAPAAPRVDAPAPVAAAPQPAASSMLEGPSFESLASAPAPAPLEATQPSLAPAPRAPEPQAAPTTPAASGMRPQGRSMGISVAPAPAPVDPDAVLDRPGGGNPADQFNDWNSLSPQGQEKALARMRYETGRTNAPSMTALPERGFLERALDSTVQKPLDNSLVGAAVETAGDAARGVVKASNTLARSAWGGVRAAADAVGADGLGDLAQESVRAADRNATALTNKRDPNSLTEKVFESTFTSLPLVLGVPGGPGAGLAAMMAQTAANEYGGSRLRGLSPSAATERAAWMGLAEGIGERVGLPQLQRLFAQAAKGASGKELGKILGDMLVREQVGEQVTMALQSGYEAMGTHGQRPGMTLDEYLNDAAETAKVTLGQSLLTGGLAGGVKKAASSQSKATQLAGALDADIHETPEEALNRAIDASPFGVARQAGFHLDPPLRTDPPVKQRGKIEEVFRNAAATVGMSPTAVDAAIKAGQGRKLGDLGAFFARFTRSASTKGLAGGELDPSIMDALAHGPLDATPQLKPPTAEQLDALDDGFQASAKAPAGPIDMLNADQLLSTLGVGQRGTESLAQGQGGQPPEGAGGPPPIPEPVPPAVAPAAAPTVVDERAHAAATSPSNDLAEPTPAQKEAGNYKVGSVRVAGLNLSIENPQGSVRRGTDRDGKAWESTLQHHYGYIRGTVGNDKDHVDVFIKPGTPPDYSGRVFVVDQVHPDTGKFDESKVMLGFASQEEAEQAYRSNYAADWQGLADITALPMPAFKAWVYSNESRKPLGNIQALTAAPAPLAAPAATAAPADAPPAAPASPAPAAPQFKATTKADGTVLVEGRPDAIKAALPGFKGITGMRGITFGKRSAKAVLAALETINAPKQDQPAEAVASAAQAADAPTAAGAAPGAGAAGVPAAGAPAAQAARLTKPKKRAKLDPERDTLLQAVAKLGGINRDELAREFGLKPEELKSTVQVGNLKAYPFRKSGGLSADAAIEQLAEAGYFDGVATDDVRRALEESIFAELGGSPRLATQGLMRDAEERGAQDAAEQQAQAEAEEFGDAEQQELDAILATNEGLRDIQRLDDDDVPGLDAPGETDPMAIMRALGFTEQEIADDLAAQAAQQGGEGQAGARAGQDAAGQAPAPGGARSEAPEGDAALSLTAPTPEELQAKVTAEAKAQAADKAEQKRLADKAKADAERDEFTLTGSDSTADAAAAAGQGGLFDAPAPAQQKKSDRLTDAGEELIRNRRGKLKGLAWDDVSGMNDTLKVAQVVKTNVWPRPDYAKMVEEGAPAWKAAVLKLVYDKIAVAPITRATPTDADLKAYIETLHQVRETLAADLDRVEKLGGAAEPWKSLKADNVFGKVFPIPADARPAFGSPSPFDRVSERGKDNNRRALMIGGNNAVQALQFSSRLLSKVKDLLSEGFPAKQEAWQKSYEVRAAETRDDDVPEAERTGQPRRRFYVYEKGSTWRLAKGMQDGGYGSQEQAEAFARSLLARKRETLPPSRGLDLGDARRTGPDWRGGKDVTAEQVMKHFGFRGVNLGEYVKAKQGVAQLHLNHVYDAFSDLADLLGVPPQAMSLNGTLGVAIGAQGSGKALAHFAPGVNEINITRDSGAGALAHEFGHALDHYFATQHGRAASMAKRPYLSAVVESVGDAGGVRPEVIEAMRMVIKTMNLRPMTEAEAKKYIADQRTSNQRRLDRWLAEFKGNKGADARALDAVAEKLKRGDVGESQDRDVETNLAELMRAAGLKPGNAIAANAFAIAYRLRDLADESRFMASHIPQVDTDYAKASDAMDAKKQGDGYWSTPWEKFARAFETFTMDALKDRQRESLYLSGMVDSEGWRNWSADTGKAVPYPAGAERLQLQQAFQKLVDTIQTRETDRGVAMFSLNDTEGADAQIDPPPSTDPEALRIAARVQGFVDRATGRHGEHQVVPLDGATASGELRSAQALARGVFGQRVQFVRLSGGPLFHGLMIPNGDSAPTLVIDVGTKKPVMAVLGHELLHSLRVTRPEVYSELKDRLDKVMSEGSTYAAKLNARRAKRGLGPLKDDVLAEERIADVVGDQFTDRAFWRDLAGAQATGWRRIGDAIVQFIDDVLHKVTKRRPFGSDTYVKDMRAARAAVVDAMAEFSRSEASGADQAEGVKLSLAEAEEPGKPAGWEIAEPTKLDRVIYELQDKLIDTKRAIEAIESTGKELKDEWDPYLQEELFHGRAAKQTTDFLDYEVKPLLQALSKAGISIADFEKFLHARHAEERNEQIAKVNPDMPDGGSGMTTADAKAYLAALPTAQRKTLDDLAEQLDAITLGTRLLLVESGLESVEAVQAWQDAYQHYVPLQRVRKGKDGSTRGTGSGFSVKGSSAKRAMGSSSEVAHILANVMMQRERAIVRGEKNIVATALYGLAIQAPNKGFWLPVDPDANQRTPAQLRELERELVSLGLQAADAASVFKEPTQRYIDDSTGFVEERINPAIRSRDNVLALRVDGKDRFVFFSEDDPRALRMVTALKNLDAAQLGEVLGTMAKITRWFAAVNTSYNPIFGIVNFTRDVQSAAFNLSSTELAGSQAEVTKHIPAAMAGVLRSLRARRDGKQPEGAWAKHFDEFETAGGRTGYRDMYATAADRADKLEDEIKRATAGKLKGAWHAMAGVLSDYNDTMENSVRLAAFKVARDKGMSTDQAASLAKNLTVNFNRKGHLTTQLGAAYAFFNAATQGSARLAQTLAGPAGKRIIAGGLLMGALQAMLLNLAGFDDDEPPEFVKDRAFIIPIGNGKYISVPMPLGLNILPGLSRNATEWALGGFKKTGAAIGTMLGLVVDGFNPLGSSTFLQTLAPTAADPLVAIAENRDFSGRPIAKEDFGHNKTPGFTRKRDATSSISVAVAEGLNRLSGGTSYKPGLVSPTGDQLDYLLGQATGGVGRELLKSFQTAEAKWTEEDLPLYRIPLLGRFVGDTRERAAISSKFYRNLEKLQLHQQEVEGRANAREPVDDYFKENPEAQLIKAADKQSKKVSDLRKLRRQLIEQKAPRERVRIIEDRIVTLMSVFNAQVKKSAANQSGAQ